MTNLPTFAGSPGERALAEQIHELLRQQGRFFSSDAPLRQHLSNLVTYFAKRLNVSPDAAAKQVSAALHANPAIFALESVKVVVDDIENEGTVERDDTLITTGINGAFQAFHVDTSHSLAARLYEPEHPLPIDDMSVVITTTRPIMPKIDPVYVSDYWLNGSSETSEGGDEGNDDIELIGESDQASAVVQPGVKSPSVRSSDAQRINLPQGISIDLAQPTAAIMALHGDAIISALRGVIEKDTLKRIAVFGNQTALESDVRSFSKNDLRQITEYIENEQQRPVEDTDILVNVLRVNSRAADFEKQRFALNFRMLKDLEFVGVAGANLWATRKLLDKVGANKRFKAADMAAFVNHLEEGFDDSTNVTTVEAIQAKGSVTHTLTFFEWEYGVLPLNDALAAILPSAVINRQSAAVVEFEVPQHSFSVSINMRFPVGNRGGWLQGFDEFFRDVLVPGAIITLKRTNKPNVVSLTYNEIEERSEQLLYIDDSKKKSKFAFGELSINSEVDEDMLPTQQAVGRIRRIKFFEISERKNINTLIDHIFMGFGEEVGTKQEPVYRMSFEQLFNVMSIYRSITRSYLMHALHESENCRVANNASGLWDCRADMVVNERSGGGFDQRGGDDEDDE
ncbi:MAG: hypothetical protein RLY87_2824 [Chloroflexota bacterium]|jgi:hypothetical protein